MGDVGVRKTPELLAAILSVPVGAVDSVYASANERRQHLGKLCKSTSFPHVTIWTCVYIYNIWTMKLVRSTRCKYVRYDEYAD